MYRSPQSERTPPYIGDARGTGGVTGVARTRSGPWRRGLVLAALAIALGLLMALHAAVPNGFAHLGSLVETILPWLGVFIPVLAVGALLRRSASAAAALLVPVVAWAYLYGGALGGLARGALTGTSHPRGDLTVASLNVDAANPDPAGTARDLAATGADVLALVELTPQATTTYEKRLARAYPYHEVRGTVGVWSRLPLSGTRPVDLETNRGPLAATIPGDVQAAGDRALRTTVTTARGPLTVYAVHLGSVRLMPRGGFWTVNRDIGAQALGTALAADHSARVVLLGDFNGTTTDRALAGITSRTRSAADVAGSGFGFTWPAAFPVVRIDQILVRGVRPVSSWQPPATGSDHLPVAAGIRM